MGLVIHFFRYFVSINAVKKYEQSKGAFTLLASQSVRLPFFLDAGRRHETSGLKTKDFIIHNNSNGQNISICDSPMSPSFHRVTRQSPGDACTCSGLCYRKRILRFVVDFQMLSHVQLFVIPWTAAHQASLSLTVTRSCSNSCPLSWWCHPTISSSVTPFSFCPQSFPASESFPVSWFFTSCDQSIGASASVLPTNIQGSFPLGLTGLISLLSKGLSRVFFSTTIQKCSAFFTRQLSHLYTTTGKNHSFDYTDLCRQNDAFAF